jgi:tRNA dimethylallyltransferase
VERALEVFMLKNEKFSTLTAKNNKNNNYQFYKIGLERDRAHLYERINKRVELMFEEGLIEEAKWVYENYRDGIEKIRAIGYKELFECFDGKLTMEEAIEMIKRDSRRYAKRQFTWFKRDVEIRWFNLDETPEDEIVSQVLNEIKL